MVGLRHTARKPQSNKSSTKKLMFDVEDRTKRRNIGVTGDGWVMDIVLKLCPLEIIISNSVNHFLNF